MRSRLLAALGLALAALLPAPCHSKTAVILTAGPMVHWNFGPNGGNPSLALEVACWRVTSSGAEGWELPDAPAWGGDLGIEFERGGKRRLYSEVQTGIGFAGVSAGPVLEIAPGNGKAWGVQGSAWGNLLIGGDLRWRRMDGATTFTPGIYAKLPLRPH
jgi:hypothetical protein